VTIFSDEIQCELYDVVLANADGHGWLVGCLKGGRGWLVGLNRA